MKEHVTKKVDWRYGRIEIFEQDEFIGKSLEIYGEWAQNEIDFLGRLLALEKMQSVVVVGANIGVQTIAFGKMLHETGTVYSFELHPVIFSVLERNIAQSQLSNVAAFNLGLWNEKQQLPLSDFPENEIVNFGGFSINEEENIAAQKKYTGDLITLDSFKYRACDLLFLDVEGAESTVIEGALATIKENHPVIYSEARNIDEAASLYNLLHRQNYKLFIFSPLAYNDQNFKNNNINIFGPNRETAMIAVPRERLDSFLQEFKGVNALAELNSYKDLSRVFLAPPFFTSKLYWAGEASLFNEEQVLYDYLDVTETDQELRFQFPLKDAVINLRFDICDKPGLAIISKLEVSAVKNDKQTTILNLDSSKKINAFCEKKDIQYLEGGGEGVFLLLGDNSHFLFSLPESVSSYEYLQIEIALSWPKTYQDFYLSSQGLIPERYDELKQKLDAHQELLNKVIDRTTSTEKSLKNNFLAEDELLHRLFDKIHIVDEKQSSIPQLINDTTSTIGEEMKKLSEHQLNQEGEFQKQKKDIQRLANKIEEISDKESSRFQVQGQQVAGLRKEISLLKQKIEKEHEEHCSQKELQKDGLKQLENIQNQVSVLLTSFTKQFDDLKEKEQKQTEELLVIKAGIDQRSNPLKRSLMKIRDFLYQLFPFIAVLSKRRGERGKIKLIKESGLFDKDFYLQQNADVLESKINPIQHYLLHGGFERRNPSKEFDSDFYFRKYPDVATSGMNPLVHYLKFGMKENRLNKPSAGRGFERIENVDQKKTILPPIFPNKVIAKKIDEKPIKQALESFGQPFKPDGSVAPDLAAQLKKSLNNLEFAVAFSHDNYLKSIGGIQVYLQDEEKLLGAQGVSYIHFYPNTHLPYKLDPSANDFSISVNVDAQEIGSFTAQELYWALSDLISNGYNCKSIQLHHFMSWNLNVIEYFIEHFKPDLKFFFVHDYFTICPQYNLLFNDKKYCHAPVLDSNACMICKYGEDRKNYFLLFKSFFEKFNFKIIAPSTIASDLWSKHFPRNRKNAVSVIPHQELEQVKDRTNASSLQLDQGKRTRIAFLGHPNSRKGWGLWRKLIDEQDLLKKVDLFHLGTRHAEHPEPFISVVNKDNRQLMEQKLRENQIDVVLLWSNWPETYSYTLFESLAAGCFIISFKDSGNIAHQVLERDVGLVLNSEEELFNLFGNQLELLIQQVGKFQRSNRKFYQLETNTSMVELIQQRH